MGDRADAHLNAGGVEFAYRQLGPSTGVPVVFLTHLAAVLDNWDPRVVDGIAAKHRVITFDNRGVGASSGSTPTTIEQMASDAVTFIRALGFDQVDLFGFSMGGMIAQVIAQEQPRLVRKMIIAGTGPAGGDGIERSPVSPTSTPREDCSPARTPSSSSSSPGPRTGAGRQGVPGTARGTYRRPRQGHLRRSFRAQLKAIHRWGRQQPADLSSIHQPVLVMNGESDRWCPPRTPSTSTGDSPTASS